MAPVGADASLYDPASMDAIGTTDAAVIVAAVLAFVIGVSLVVAAAICGCCKSKKNESQMVGVAEAGIEQ